MAISQVKVITNLKWFNQTTAKKVKAKDQAMFLQTLYELLTEGFSLNQALVFMELLLPHYRPLIKILVQYLEQGAGLEKGLRQIGYSLSVVAQIFYGQKQGRFYPTIKKCAESLQQQDYYRQKMIKTLTYPLVMFVFLIVLLLGMRQFLLPQIVSFISVEVYQKNKFMQFLVGFFSYLPQLLVGILGLFIMIYFLFDLILMRQTYLNRYRMLIVFPLVQHWVRSYCTYKVSQTLGYFLEGGFSLQQTFEFIVQYPIDPFLSEVAQSLTRALRQGDSLSESLDGMEIFKPELGMIIYQGELTSQLSTKCLMFANKLFFELMEDIAKKINYLQPILFLIIAVLVMGMYLMMMLPMLTMEGL